MSGNNALYVAMVQKSPSAQQPNGKSPKKETPPKKESHSASKSRKSDAAKLLTDEEELARIIDEIDNQTATEKAWNILVDIALAVSFAAFLPIAAIGWNLAGDTWEKYQMAKEFEKLERQGKQIGSFEDRFRQLTGTMLVDVNLALRWNYILAFGFSLIVCGVIYSLWKSGRLFGAPKKRDRLSMFHLARFIFRATLSLGTSVCVLTILVPIYYACMTTGTLQGILVKWADEHFWAVRFVGLQLKFGTLFTYKVPALMEFVKKGIFVLIPIILRKFWTGLKELHNQQQFMQKENIVLQDSLGRLNERLEEVQHVAETQGPLPKDDDVVNVPDRAAKKAARTTLIELSKLGLLDEHMKWFDKKQVQPFFHDPDQTFSNQTPQATPGSFKQGKSRLSVGSMGSLGSMASSKLNDTPSTYRRGGTPPASVQMPRYRGEDRDREHKHHERKHNSDGHHHHQSGRHSGDGSRHSSEHHRPRHSSGSGSKY